jgi:hypothetical protein
MVLQLQSFDCHDAPSPAKRSAMVGGNGLGEFRNGVGLILS